ncbi:dTDP-glucose 4,6-dehydratase [Candidatus Omnitrophota bacterium]
MRSKLSKILVTGGAGFIGSAFVRLAVKKGHKVSVVDKLTYAADPARLKDLKSKIRFYKADIGNAKRIAMILGTNRFDAIVNFAAETHVDRSIKDASPFFDTNLKGVQVLLDAARKRRIKRFLQISTDEVYGEIEKGAFGEGAPLLPNSPYAASKAAADLLIRSYIRTYNLPAVIIRPSNNYGPWQYPEKFMPLAILRVLKGEKIPVYGKGENVREWLYVDDCARGVYQIMQKGRSGEIYNLGSHSELPNIRVAKAISKIISGDDGKIIFVRDRPGHDIRYRLNSAKAFKETGWRPKVDFRNGLKATLRWYIKHQAWALSKWEDVARFYGF